MLTGVICCALSALGFYFSLGLGEQWWLAWLAPVPVLWFAYGPASSRASAMVSLAALALGLSSLLRVYAGLLPAGVLVAAMLGPAALFVLCVQVSRGLYRRWGPAVAAPAFAVLWTAVDFLTAFSRGGGAIATPAASEVGAPALIQAASLVGFPGITFLIGFVAAGLAGALRTRSWQPMLAPAVLFIANGAFGAAHLAATPDGQMRVALVESDSAYVNRRVEDRAAALEVIDRYAAAIAGLRGSGTQLVVLPENIARIGPQWEREVWSRLATAAEATGATVVAGFNAPVDGAQRNISWAFAPGSALPILYAKRRLVPGLESDVYAPGPGPRMQAGTGLEICKDMDFHAMIRADAVSLRPAVLAVPAWDFGGDGWGHARAGILRSVENGVPMVRTARDGLLTVNDRYGRLLLRARSTDRMTVLTTDLPTYGPSGGTVYDRIGDVFGWLNVAAAALLILGAASRPTRLARAASAPRITRRRTR